MVTCAPGTLAPLASLTVPTILPRSTWATKLEVLATTTKAKANFKARLVTGGACMVPPLACGTERCIVTGFNTPAGPPSQGAQCIREIVCSKHQTYNFRA